MASDPNGHPANISLGDTDISGLVEWCDLSGDTGMSFVFAAAKINHLLIRKDPYIVVRSIFMAKCLCLAGLFLLQ